MILKLNHLLNEDPSDWIDIGQVLSKCSEDTVARTSEFPADIAERIDGLVNDFVQAVLDDALSEGEALKGLMGCGPEVLEVFERKLSEKGS